MQSGLWCITSLLAQLSGGKIAGIYSTQIIFFICLNQALGRPKFSGISLPHFFGQDFIIQSQRAPIWAIWKSFSVAAEPLNTPDPHPHCHPTHCWEYLGFRGLAATLNDFQMAQMGSRCDCMIKSHPKKFGREIGRHPFLRWWGVNVFSIIES